MALGRDDLFRDPSPTATSTTTTPGVVEYPGSVFVNIIHSWVAPTKFNEEYTRLIGVKGGVDFNSGTFSYRPDQKKPDRGCGGPGDSTTRCSRSRPSSTRSGPASAPVCTVEHGRAAVLACLLVPRPSTPGGWRR